MAVIAAGHRLCGYKSINLDAHFDLRKPSENRITSGTPFYQIHDLLAQRGQKMNYLCIGISETSNTKSLFERSHEWGVQYMLDTEMRPHLFHQVTDKIDRFLENCDYLYLSVDLDVLPHWQMPGVSAPTPYGINLEIIEDIITHLATKKTNGYFLTSLNLTLNTTWIIMAQKPPPAYAIKLFEQ